MKDNQKLFHEAIIDYFDEAIASGNSELCQLQCYEETPAEHGRIEIRRCYLSTCLATLPDTSDRYPLVADLSDQLPKLKEMMATRRNDRSCQHHLPPGPEVHASTGGSLPQRAEAPGRHELENGRIEHQNLLRRRQNGQPIDFLLATRQGEFMKNGVILLTQELQSESNVLATVTSIFVVAVFMERSVEAILTPIRAPDRQKIEQELEDIRKTAETGEGKKNELRMKERELEQYKLSTIQGLWRDWLSQMHWLN